MSARLAKTLEIRTSPHIVSGYSVDSIMFNVVVALAPATLFAVYAFGAAAVAVVATAVASCVGFEHLLCRATGRATTGRQMLPSSRIASATFKNPTTPIDHDGRP